MEQRELLNALNCPAFTVKEGKIVQANIPALQHNIEVDTPVAVYIRTGLQEYENFTSGKLCLGLTINTIPCTACVTCVDEGHLFCLETEYAEPEFRAFSLAAQHLREPISGAMYGAELLLSELGENEAAKEKLARLNKNLYKLLRTVTNMSDAALYRAQQLQHQEYGDITANTREIFEKAANLAQKAGRTLEYKLPKESIYSLADRQKLERGILNMLSNALKYSPASSTVLAELKHSNNRLYFTVENTLNQSISDNPFTRYLREPGIENSENGIGLGMAIVQAVATSHGGTVLMEQHRKNAVRITLAIKVQASNSLLLRSPVLYPADYAGGIDKTLLELCDILPDSLFADSE